jgi:tRNA (guanine10-N2)-dimethyltransferase
VVDPFCGTGGIVIEAALQGLETLASDLDGRMVEGTRQNLDWAGVSASVEMSAVADVASVWGERSGCIFAFDPPYGRSSWKSDDGLELLLEAMSAAHQIDSQGAVCTMLPAGPETLSQESEQDYQVMGKPWGEVEAQIREHGWVPVLKSPIRVHRSLARMVVVCHPAD